jgi:hypothetical protein
MFKIFQKKTLTEQYGTPWEITLADGTTRRPYNDAEGLSELIDYLAPSPTRPLVLRHEDNTVTATSHYDAMLFIYTHTAR